jgi:predicted dehydrogenase
MKQYGVLLVGCGYMGEEHIKKIFKKKNLKIIGVIDIDISKAKILANKYFAMSFSANYKDYKDCDGLDIVIIATYPSTHFEIAQFFLKRGKHILCEKPITNSIEELIKFESLVNNAESKFLVGHILRHNLTYQKVAQMIKSGMIGNPITMRISVLKNISECWNYQINLLKDVAPIVDCGVHYIDMMRWFTGEEVISINGIGQKFFPETIASKNNYEMINVMLSGGSSGFIEIEWDKCVKEESKKEFIGPYGVIRIIYQSQTNTSDNSGNIIEFQLKNDGSSEEAYIPYDGKPTDIQFDYLIEMIEKNIDHQILFNEMCIATRIALLSEQAILSNRTVYFHKNLANSIAHLK